MKAYFKVFEDQKSLPEAPGRFTFPFNYQVHPLSELAVSELQRELETYWDQSDFGDKDEQGDEGKMFGVLVVRNTNGEIGYLKAYSGKLNTPELTHDFVPFVYDAEDEDGFLKKGEEQVLAMGREIKKLEDDPDFADKFTTFKQAASEARKELERLRSDLSDSKKRRLLLNTSAPTKGHDKELRSLVAETKEKKAVLRKFSESWNKKEKQQREAIQEQLDKINVLKKDRAALSAKLQKQLFSEYTILNNLGESISLSEIFTDTISGVPPAGSGDCAAPKLLQFAFLNELEPLSMAEFWWGQSPVTRLRRHGQFYPACKGKCKPILGHMLKGLEVDPDPMADHPSITTPLKILYEDEHIIAVNKPSGLLSVPGKQVEDSVYSRILERFPDASDHLIVHRLDLATSGVMLLTKDKESHKALQQQFADRSIKKTYVAVLDGRIEAEKGIIDLPLRVDLDNRPQQMVCYEHGKAAVTHWLKLEEKENRTRVHFFPLTGRTHQLRVHAAHPSGLNSPIVGDEIYGRPEKRLHLHAKEIRFMHPITGKQMKVKAEEEF